ncbi:MAG: AAA family ATPase [Herpetosiphonaceae bacterium]|nr:AAA family ATPase [Herpetosiphonaceae bacterium]
MIQQVAIRHFKRFDDETFTFPDHVVLAGPNNTGKTTVLQAIAAWELALNHWRLLNDFQKRRHGYTRAPIARQAFAAVPLRAFDLLWNQRQARGSIEIAVIGRDGWQITMEFIADSTEQIYVRPTSAASATDLRVLAIRTVFVPPMTGLSTDEPVYQPAKQRQLLGQGKPGDILRNLLIRASEDQRVWRELQKAIDDLFRYQLLPPNALGAHIVAEYQASPGGPKLDIASAGSGFQQILMLLTFLYTHEGSVLLLDEPDAHLHVILQARIYSKLRSVAAERKSQLIISTHSEVIIDSVEPRELCMLLNRPKLLTNVAERDQLRKALAVLSNMDILLALEAPGILYAEGHTDINLLGAWAKALQHPLHDLFSKGLFWREAVSTEPLGGRGCKASDHFEALKLVKPAMRGVELIDGDAHPNIQNTALAEGKLQRLRWSRYEIESYLFHPAALERYIEAKVGRDIAEVHLAAARQYMQDNLPPAVLREPLGDHDYLNTTKARTQLIPPILHAAGLDTPYSDFNEIAAVMLPEEIHPEVREKLDAIQQAFNL